MSWFFNILFAAISCFVATNIDDIVILMLFFSQTSDRFRPRHIIIGQYLGFTVLILASLPGLIGGLIIPRVWIGLLGLLPIIIGIKQLLDREREEETVQTVSQNDNFIALLPFKFVNIQTYNVAAVTIANGGDNIGIYVPLFASNNLLSFVITLSIFYFLVGVWCLVAYLLTRQPSLAKLLSRYGHAIIPFVLIGLGIFILIESKTYEIFKNIL
jgi:cadmium resistance transport/sequestration family protein